ncbi:MAG: hypothetical protein H0U61_11665 [Nocardioidaceae bacterium]|nr:hypothetical protein [Nocardioidaceae bacterium]
MIAYAWSASSIASLTPVTVTGCGVDQLPGVKSSEPVDTVPSLVSVLATEIVTFALGWLLRRTCTICDVNPSLVVTDDGDAITPAVSLSVIDTVTEPTDSPL